MGETWVMSNTMVNNLRLSVDRTSVVRTNADLFGPADVGVKMYSHVPNYMNITITGASVLAVAASVSTTARSSAWPTRCRRRWPGC